MGIGSINFNSSINGQIQGPKNTQRKPDINPSISIFAAERTKNVSTLQYILNDEDPGNDKSGKVKFATDMTNLLNQVSSIQPQTTKVLDEINQIRSAMYKYQ